MNYFQRWSNEMTLFFSHSSAQITYAKLTFPSLSELKWDLDFVGLEGPIHYHVFKVQAMMGSS